MKLYCYSTETKRLRKKLNSAPLTKTIEQLAGNKVDGNTLSDAVQCARLLYILLTEYDFKLNKKEIDFVINGVTLYNNEVKYRNKHEETVAKSVVFNYHNLISIVTAYRSLIHKLPSYVIIYNKDVFCVYGDTILHCDEFHLENEDKDKCIGIKDYIKITMPINKDNLLYTIENHIHDE